MHASTVYVFPKQNVLLRQRSPVRRNVLYCTHQQVGEERAIRRSVRPVEAAPFVAHPCPIVVILLHNEHGHLCRHREGWERTKNRGETNNPCDIYDTCAMSGNRPAPHDIIVRDSERCYFRAIG